VIFDGERAQPFFRHGLHGVMRGAAVAFFGYTSFEQPITVAEEAINPQRDLPKSLTRQIIIETIQYSVLAYLVSGFIDIDKITD
jgi:APA family basic amino acid/polyamine antiporter